MVLRKVFILLLAVFGLSFGSMAHPVDQETAKAIAVKFLKTGDLQIASIYKTENNVAALYVFNTSDGFVIVAADDCETPIIGYSREGCFDPDDVPIQMQEYLQDFVVKIQYGIENQIVADEITARQWDLVKATGRLNDSKSVKAVAPLITTRWHQGCLYNNLCPATEYGPCDHAEVGCVAVAMAQIMHYWKYPLTGYGSHSYYSSIGGVLSADFGNTLYEWDLMPDTLSETSSSDEIEAVATLLYHCGISVDMMYTTNGSGAHVSDVLVALKQHFRYSNELHSEKPNNDMAEWLNKLKECLNEERPILYSGQSNRGHAFVCDGYDENDLLHFNWGWGGNGDGYYALGNLNPLGNNYSNGNSAILDINPDHSTPHTVSASAIPPYGGSIEGNGSYFNDQPCVLTAIPAEDFEFFYWKQDHRIVSYDSVYSLFAIDDVNDIEAIFSLKPVRNITANVIQDIVNLSWSSQGHNGWPLLKELNNITAKGIATDGNYIYISKSDDQEKFWKYTMDGVFVEKFWSESFYSPTELTYDGNYFYCNGANTAYLYTVDLANHTPIATIRTGYTPICSYDHIRDGIWIASYNSQNRVYRLKLIDRNGTLVQYGPTLPSRTIPNGSGFFVGEDRDSHLFVKTEKGKVFDYDIDQDAFHPQPFTEIGDSFGAYIGQYDGKNAMYVCYPNSVKVFEIRSALWPITCYRLYRSDNHGKITCLADEAISSSYTDASWGHLGAGLYRYGISSVFANGNESEILWSEPIPKGNYGIEDNEDPSGPSVRKIFVNGHVVIIKDGKRYNIIGQEIQ